MNSYVITNEANEAITFVVKNNEMYMETHGLSSGCYKVSYLKGLKGLPAETWKMIGEAEKAWDGKTFVK